MRITLLALLTLSFGAAAVAADTTTDAKTGETLIGCLSDTGIEGGYVLSEGTVDGVAVTGPEKLANHVGHWVKLDGESFTKDGKEHFRARTVTHVAATCAEGRTNLGGAVATLKNPAGDTVGSARLRQAPHGVLLSVELRGLPAGQHAFHVHETGSCEASDFTSAGGHFNPTDVSHGYFHGESHHAGDMPNFEVPANGNVQLEVLNAMVSLGERSLMDADGSALVVHGGTDDYKSQPSGAAGKRIACGVIEKAK